jgi:methylmalonyl-CoA/ethylmalonyl-CoA epimerase
MLDATLDHVAIAVRDIVSSMRVFVDALGGTFLFAGDSDEQGFRWAQFGLPRGGKIELVSPLQGDGFVRRFLDRRGEGVHHLTLKVPDIEQAIAHLRRSGVEPIRISTEHRSWKEAFIHPRDGHGVLIQVAQSAFDDEETARHHLLDHSSSDHRHISLQDLLSGVPDAPGRTAADQGL